mgnify:CR=1 FL=1
MTVEFDSKSFLYADTQNTCNNYVPDRICPVFILFSWHLIFLYFRHIFVLTQCFRMIYDLKSNIVIQHNASALLSINQSPSYKTTLHRADQLLHSLIHYFHDHIFSHFMKHVYSRVFSCHRRLGTNQEEHCHLQPDRPAYLPCHIPPVSCSYTNSQSSTLISPRKSTTIHSNYAGRRG